MGPLTSHLLLGRFDCRAGVWTRLPAMEQTLGGAQQALYEAGWSSSA
jgi:hypothetical protein